MWVRADMDGYISRFDGYLGKVTDANETSTPGDNEGHKKHHEFYFDNFFTSVPLMEYLKENGVKAAGTV